MKRIRIKIIDKLLVSAANLAILAAYAEVEPGALESILAQMIDRGELTRDPAGTYRLRKVIARETGSQKWFAVADTGRVFFTSSRHEATPFCAVDAATIPGSHPTCRGLNFELETVS